MQDDREPWNPRTRFVFASSDWQIEPSDAVRVARIEVRRQFGDRRADHPGMLAVCLGSSGPRVHFARHLGERAVVVGRHTECGVGVSARLRATALRHVLLWSEGREELPVTRVVDLGSQQGIRLCGHGPIAGARICGPAVLQCGEAIVVFGQVRAGQTFLDALPSEIPHWCVVDEVTGPNPWSPQHQDGVTLVAPLAPPEELTAPSLPAGTSEPAALRLRLRNPPEEAVVLSFTRQQLERGILVGRYARCRGSRTLVLANHVSRVHMAIVLDGDVIMGVDLASSNGTWVNGRRVAYTELKRGRRVMLSEGEDAVDFEVL